MREGEGEEEEKEEWETACQDFSWAIRSIWNGSVCGWVVVVVVVGGDKRSNHSRKAGDGILGGLDEG